MLNLKPENEVNIFENTLVSCETAGIYCQGEASRPFIKGNKIRFCRCSAIISYLGVAADVSLFSCNNIQIFLNELSINDTGIEIQNNKSRIIENFIEKSHENGIKVLSDNPDSRSKPQIYKNKIFSCGFNGILC